MVRPRVTILGAPGVHLAKNARWQAQSSPRGVGCRLQHTGSRDLAVLRTERSRIARWLSEAMKLRRYDYSTEHEEHLRGRMGGEC